MNPLRLLGALLVVGTGGAVGQLAGARLRLRRAALADWLSALQLLQTEIRFGVQPLPRALGRVAAASRGPAGQLCRAVRAALATQDLRQAWQDRVRAMAEALPLTREDVAPLLDLGEVLGGSSREDQERHLTLCCARLSAQLQEAAQAEASGVRLFQYLGWSAGVCLVLLLA